MHLTPRQQAVLEGIAQAGALTSRRVQDKYGPRPNWFGLLERSLLREYRTVYGPVVALTPRGHLWRRAEGLPEAHYLTAPTTVTDRAYLNDALEILTEKGYSVAHTVYKRSGGLSHQSTHTDQVTRTVLRVPLRIEAQLQHDWGFVYNFKLAYDGGFHEQLGHPSLYASITNGGLKSAGIKALYKRHRMDIHEWRHPLLVAVPDADRLRAFVRAREMADKITRGPDDGPLRFPYPLVRVIVLPLP